MKEIESGLNLPKSESNKLHSIADIASDLIRLLNAALAPMECHVVMAAICSHSSIDTNNGNVAQMSIHWFDNHESNQWLKTAIRTAVEHEVALQKAKREGKTQ